MSYQTIIEQTVKKLEEQLKAWKIPSASLAVVKDGQVLYTGGIGLRDNKEQKADENTLYPIASCSKAFTATALAVLATEGKVDFDTPIIEYMPEFRLKDEYATFHLTLRDLLSHRSGLPRHELAWYGTGYGRKQLMENLKYLQVNAPIRYRFQYCNFNYMIAGQVAEAITGMPFEDFLMEKLLKPLGMDHSLVFGADFRKADNRALAFNSIKEYDMGDIMQIPYYESPAEAEGTGDPTAAAGCICSTAADMTKWLLFNLNHGKVDGKQLVREDLMALIASPHIFLGEGGSAFAPERASESYALGWSIYQYRGHKMVEHGGNINGFTATNAWVPDLNLGIFMDVNRDVALLADAVVHELIDSFLREAGEPVPDAGWNDRIYQYNSDMFESVKKLFLSFGGEAIPGTSPSHEMAAYAGWYEAPGYRRALVTEENGALTLDFNHFIVGLKHHHYDTFATTGLLGELPSGLNVRFETRADGIVDRVVILLGSEKDLDPIVFVRKDKEE